MMTRWHWFTSFGALVVLVGVFECGGTGTSGGDQDLPDGTVTSNTKADPSCGTCVQRKICVKPAVGGGNPCSSGWLPDDVTNCVKGAAWPACKR
jgi:hypothetical protein